MVNGNDLNRKGRKGREGFARAVFFPGTAARPFQKTLTASAASLCALCVLCGVCAVDAQPVKNPDTLVYAITGDVDSLDPHWEFDAVSQEVDYQLYETLIFFHGASVDQFEPMLATNVPTHENGFLSSDGLEYRFPIRKGVRFHDGSLLTPEDVKYSFMRFLLMDRASGPSYLLLEPILGVSSTLGEDGKPDERLWDAADRAVSVEGGAVVLRLQKPYAPLLSILASWPPVVSKKWVVAHGGWDGRKQTWLKFRDPAKDQTPLYDQADGTGPFMLERWDKQNEQVILARNDRYWRAPARLDHVVFRTVADQNTRRLMLQNGDVDAVVGDREYLPQFAGIPGVTVQDDLPLLEVHDAFVYPLDINLEGSPYVGSGRLDGDGIPADFFKDIDVRKGFAYAFDYDAYIRDGYRGKAQQARGPIPAGVFGYNPRQPVYSHDLQRAERHFRKAFGGRLWDTGFRFTLTYMEGAADRRLACQILKKNVESLNPKFRVDVRGVLWSTWLSQWSARRIPMANARWALDYPDPDSAVVPFLSADGYYAKVQGYDNPRADRYIDDARREPDRDRRRQDYYELQAIAYADAPQLYTVDTYFFDVRRSWVQGWYYNPIVLYGYLYPVYKAAPTTIQ